MSENPASPTILAEPSAPPRPWPTPQPRQEGFFEKRWPGPRDPGTGAPGGISVPAGVLAGALGFAVFVPLGRTGIGWFLGGLVAVVAVVVAATRGNAAPGGATLGGTALNGAAHGGTQGVATTVSRRERVISLLWAVSALALLSVLTFRNAWWLVTFCVLGALCCAALAAAGGKSIRSILFSLLAAPLAAFLSLTWVRKKMESARRSQARAGMGKRLGWSVVVTAALLLVFGALFASADAAFSELMGRYIPRVDAGIVFGWLFLFVVGALATGASIYLVSAPPDLSGMETPSRRRIGRAEWTLPILALVLLFTGFVVVQITVLFGGQRHVLNTVGLEYADYARGGFWQLVTVTILTLLIISAVTRWASRESRGERVTLRVLLGLLAGLSMVIVASALFRMYTYQQAYSFTGERIFVMAFELLLGSIFILVLLAGITWRGAWIPRTVAALAVAMLLSLAVLNPEAYAAERNIARYNDVGKIDAWYLRALSADATPALAMLPDEVRRCTLMWIGPELAEQDPWYAWNLGRQRAREVLRSLGPWSIGDCKGADAYDYPKVR